MRKIVYYTFCAVFVLSTLMACKKDKKEESNQTSETPADQFTDGRDGKVYKTVIIGTQTWMAENLNYEVVGSVCYNALADSCAKYGKLYDGVTAQSACPSGYHLPTDAEWQTMEIYLGMTQSDADMSGSNPRGTDQGTKLKVGGSSGFNSKLSGIFNGSYVGVGQYTYFWTSTQDPLSSTDSFYRAFTQASGGIYRDYTTNNSDNKFCVRCVKD
jgi:uncharacterized protein (TIGR02145 family)